VNSTNHDCPQKAVFHTLLSLPAVGLHLFSSTAYSATRTVRFLSLSDKLSLHPGIICRITRPNPIFNFLMTLRSVHFETQTISYMTCCASHIGSKPTASKFGYFVRLKINLYFSLQGGFIFYCVTEMDWNYRTQKFLACH